MDKINFFQKDDDDKEGERYLAYSDYLEYMNGDTSKAGAFQRYRGKITEDICESKGIDAQYNIFGGIMDSEIQNMIIVVGAAQNTGKHSFWGKCKHTGYEVTAYSNRGSRVDVLAPGGEKTIDGISDASIYSTVPYGNGYDGLVGTSMACPHVAGVAAMIFGIDPTFTAKEVKDIIISTATGSYGSVKEQYPLLNARLAVEKAIKLSNEKAKGQTGDDLPFEPSGEHQYRIFYDALTWEEAKAACEAKGGHLATITSEEEQQKLNLYNAGNHKLWIGGYKNTERQWCWVTGEPWEYENWATVNLIIPVMSLREKAVLPCGRKNGTTLRIVMFMSKADTFANGKHPMWPRKHRSKVTQDTSMSSIHCPNRSGSPAQSHGSKQRDAASGKAVIWRSLNRQRKISFSTVQ